MRRPNQTKRFKVYVENAAPDNSKGNPMRFILAIVIFASLFALPAPQAEAGHGKLCAVAKKLFGRERRANRRAARQARGGFGIFVRGC